MLASSHRIDANQDLRRGVDCTRTLHRVTVEIARQGQFGLAAHPTQRAGCSQATGDAWLDA
jgi:hypothetical protein